MEWRKHKTGDVTGHYTAMMWKNNKQLGCGMGINVEKGCQVTVCNYRSTLPTNSVGLEKDQVKCTHPINIDDAENGRLNLSTQTPIMVQQITPHRVLMQ